jgi:small multidrug resistance pump
MSELDRYKPWFYAAAVYNAIWGTAAVLFPNVFFSAFGMKIPNYPQLFQGIGMIVGVYAIAYWLIAKNPERYGPFVYVGLLGKIFGPIGFVFGAMRGELPWAFGWINVFNDLIWLPAFIGFSRAVWKRDRLG